jgi:hypothetical protein
MSQATRWDFQLNQVEMAISDLMNEASLKPDPVASSATIADRDQIDQSLARIAVDSDKVIQAARKAQMGGRANAAIGWWTKQFAMKVKAVSTEYVALQNRKMWLRLLQARFSGIPAKDSLDLQAKHLVDLALRKKQLVEIEADLKRQMDSIVREREQLRSDYYALGIADENWSASGSFQSRLGVTLDHARDNPSAKAFSEWLSAISVPSVHPEEDQWLRKVDDDLRVKSGSLAEQCRTLASAIATGAGIADKISTLHFKNTMDQVVALNNQLVRRFAALKSLPVRQSRPKLVQNHQKSGTTSAHR